MENCAYLRKNPGYAPGIGFNSSCYSLSFSSILPYLDNSVSDVAFHIVLVS